MMNRKVRRFKVGESLNTIFSARQFGLALAVDIEEALKDFPKQTEATIYEVYMAWEVNEWIKKWFSDFTTNSEDDKDEA